LQAFVLSLFARGLLLAVPISQGAAAEGDGLRFARIIGDGMVLQRGKEARVWGWAAPGADVLVTITEDRVAAAPFLPEAGPGDTDVAHSVTMQYTERNAPAFSPQTRTAVADGDGAWQVAFSSMPAGFTPKYIVAKAGDEGVAVGDVLIGEVWVCAGQSNMGWGNFNRKDREVASADFPGLRYVAWHDSWYRPLEDVRSNIRWRACSPESAKGFAAVPYLYGMFLHRYLKVPVGIINVARGGTLGQTWCLREELESVDSEIIETVLKDYDAETATWDDPEAVKRIMADWEKVCEDVRDDHEKKIAAARAAGKKEPRLRLPKKPGDPRSGWSPPAGLFNATVMPIRRLGIGGVLYYQGENQAFNAWTRYEYTFPRIPVSFREAFGDDQLPFGCISQPGWGTFGLDPEVATSRGGYQVVRDIQQRALKGDPHAGMIATYPTGNSYIHPGEKFPVAEYASLWALAKVYGKPVVHRANTYQSMKKRGDKIYLFFDSDPVVYDRWKHIENNAYWQVLPCPREGNAEFLGFIIADSDRRWYPAKARHTRLDKEPCIEVWSDLVRDPVAVRYGWASWPTGNMVGRERLPLPVFRTDDWQLPIGMNYSEEAVAESKAQQAALRERGERQALDRKIRQLQIDLPPLEHELHVRKNKSVTGLVESKLARLEVILDELQKEPWLSGQVHNQLALGDRIQAIRDAVEAAKGEMGRR